MTWVSSNLATAIKGSLGFSTEPMSTQIEGISKAIIDELKAATFSHALVTGTTTAASPLTLGAAANGILAGMTGASLANRMKTEAGFDSVTSQLQGMADAIVAHIQALGKVAFASTKITGNCTSTPVAPGPLLLGAGSDGILGGLVGSTLAAAMSSGAFAGQTSSQLSAMCSDMVSYLMTNGVGVYIAGQVTGTCPTAAGPLSLGLGAGGTFT